MKKQIPIIKILLHAAAAVTAMTALVSPAHAAGRIDASTLVSVPHGHSTE